MLTVSVWLNEPGPRGPAHLQGAIRVGVDGNRADTHLSQRADDSQRDLAAIGYQNLREH